MRRNRLLISAKNVFAGCSWVWRVKGLLIGKIMLLRLLVFATVVALGCFGQHLKLGLKAGVPVTEAFETGSFFTLGFGEGATSATRRYTIGPMIGLRLPHGFDLEFDALYKRLGFDDLTKSAGVYYVHTRTTANSREFPILGTFRFLHLPVLSPYIGAGVSFRHVGGISSMTEQPLLFPSIPVMRSTGTTSPTLNNRSRHGGTLGLGAGMRVGFLHVSPEIRYTRWGADRDLNSVLHSNENQVDFLLGIAF